MKELDYTRTVNARFLGLLVASLFVLAFGVVYVHGYQIRRNAGIFLRQAEQAEEGSRLDEAAKYYFLYLGYRPDNTEARIAWAGVLERKSGTSQRDLRRLYDVYEAVLRRQPELSEIRRNLVNVAVAMQRFSDAREHIEHLLGGFAQNETDPQRLQELGELEQLYALCC